MTLYMHVDTHKMYFYIEIVIIMNRTNSYLNELEKN